MLSCFSLCKQESFWALFQNPPTILCKSSIKTIWRFIYFKLVAIIILNINKYTEEKALPAKIFNKRLEKVSAQKNSQEARDNKEAEF